jgi:hypothetical protein
MVIGGKHGMDTTVAGQEPSGQGKSCGSRWESKVMRLVENAIIWPSKIWASYCS